MRIHTFGDSHSRAAFERIKNINIHYLGPILCHSFGRDGLNCLNLKKHNVSNGDCVVFCFGEIDCRCHIYKHLNEKSYDQQISYIVNKYFEAINENIKQFKNIKTFVYNIVPPLKNQEKNQDIHFPILGTGQQRKEFVCFFNESLKQKCKENGYIFLNVYEKYCDEEGFLKEDLSDGHAHIKNPIYIEEFLKNNL